MSSPVIYLLLLLKIVCFVDGQYYKKKPEPYGVYRVSPPFMSRTTRCIVDSFNLTGEELTGKVQTDHLKITLASRLDMNPPALFWNCSSVLADAEAADLRIYMLNVKFNETYKADYKHYKPAREWNKRCTRWQVDYRVPLRCELLIPLTHENLGRWMFRCDFGVLSRDPKTKWAPYNEPLNHSFVPVCTSEEIHYNVTFRNLARPTLGTTYIPKKTTTVVFNYRGRNRKQRLKKYPNGSLVYINGDLLYENTSRMDLPWDPAPIPPGPHWPWPNITISSKTAVGVSAGSILLLVILPLLICFCIVLCQTRKRYRQAEPCPCSKRAEEQEYDY